MTKSHATAECLALAMLFAAAAAFPGLAAPSVALSPVTDHPASTTSVSGAGFGASKAVDVYWDTTDVLLVVSNASGAIARHSVPVPAGALPGIHWISAIERDNGNAAQASFNVRTNWVEHGFGAHGKRTNPYENVISTANVDSLDVAWSYTTGNLVESSPAVVNGLLYVGSYDGNLYALDAATGAKKWSAPTGAAIFDSSPAVAKGIVYVGSEDGKVYAFNATTGVLKWTKTTGGQVESSPTVSNGIVYIGSDDGNLYALDAATGAVNWSAPTGGAIYSAPAVVNGTVYAGSVDASLYAFDAGSGAQLWNYTTGGIIYGSPAVANGLVYFGSMDNKLYAIDATGGGFVSSYPISGGISSSPALAGGVAYVAGDDAYLSAVKFGPAGSQLQWRTSTLNLVESSPAVANGIVYFGSGINWVWALDAASGALLWQAKTNNSVNSSPAVANGMLYVGSRDHNVYAYALNAGANAAYRRDTRPPSFATLHPDYRLKPAR
jgi:outer membrane protein assembly factor BamB